jgi:hypothetical protein
MICPYCNQPAKFVDNAEIYNGTRYGNSYMMWWCRPCDALVGTHHNDPDKPLGTMANKELRVWRRKAHAAFDPLWKSKKMTRQEAYHWLYEQTGKWIHMGESDIEMCKLVISKVEELNQILEGLKK